MQSSANFRPVSHGLAPGVSLIILFMLLFNSHAVPVPLQFSSSSSSSSSITYLLPPSPRLRRPPPPFPFPPPFPPPPLPSLLPCKILSLNMPESKPPEMHRNATCSSTCRGLILSLTVIIRNVLSGSSTSNSLRKQTVLTGSNDSIQATYYSQQAWALICASQWEYSHYQTF